MEMDHPAAHKCGRGHARRLHKAIFVHERQFCPVLRYHTFSCKASYSYSESQVTKNCAE